jgi:hypothetical protein
LSSLDARCAVARREMGVPKTDAGGYEAFEIEYLLCITIMMLDGKLMIGMNRASQSLIP